MSGPKRNPDRLNTIGVVVVGICGAVLVYVSIVALQAFYLNDTAEIQTMARSQVPPSGSAGCGSSCSSLRRTTPIGSTAVLGIILPAVASSSAGIR